MIDSNRQEYLTNLHNSADPDNDVYPFMGEQLSRGDIEWLVSTFTSTDLVLVGADLSGEQLSGIVLMNADLREVDFNGATLEGAILVRADLRGANLINAVLKKAELQSARLEGADLIRAELHNAKFQDTYFSDETRLDRTNFGDTTEGFAHLRGVHWGGVDLTGVLWEDVSMVGEEWILGRQGTGGYSSIIEAVRATRQLANVLRGQGLNEDADRFSYRAQVLLRRSRAAVWRNSGVRARIRIQMLRWWVTLVALELLAGYGFKPGRVLLWYFGVNATFCLLYNFVGQSVKDHLSPLQAAVFSVTSFHGRGFFPGNDKLDNPRIMLAAVEAVVGLFIEISFIASFTQRFLSR